MVSARAWMILGIGVVLAGRAVAAGVPDSIDQQGRFLKMDGSPETGTLQVTFALYDAQQAGAVLWSEMDAITLDQGGFYAVNLGVAKAFPAGVWDGRTLFLGVTVQGEPEMSPRQPVVSVPYAIRAGEALDAVGDIHPKSITVNGQTIVDANGRVSAPVPIVTKLPATGDGTPMSPIGVAKASMMGDGYLSAADWSTFNGKVTSVAAGTAIAIAGTPTVPTVGVLLGNAANTAAAGNDPRLSDARDPLPGSAAYIQNGANVQNGAQFNVAGNGRVGGTMTVGGGRVILGANPNESLTAAQAATLTGGGNADGLHTHAGLNKPWIQAGANDTFANFQALLAKYPQAQYQWGIAYNHIGGSVIPVKMSSWNRGWRIVTDEYLVHDGNNVDPPNGGFQMGGAAWFYDTIGTFDDSCTNQGQLKHLYWYWSGGQIVFSGGNGCGGGTWWVRAL